MFPHIVHSSTRDTVKVKRLYSYPYPANLDSKKGRQTFVAFLLKRKKFNLNFQQGIHRILTKQH